MSKSAKIDLLRAAILTSIPEVPSHFDEVEPKYVHIPAIHRRALEPDAMLVVGDRGAGKSFWWNALQDEALRHAVMGKKVSASVGFGHRNDEKWPEKDELEQLLGRGFKARLIWKTIVLLQISPETCNAGDWCERVSWVIDNPSKVATAFREFDEELAARGGKHVVLFDALDRTADSSNAKNLLLKGLLELVLELRPYAGLRAKVFVRPDMLSDPQVKAFTDASKVIASAVRLDWYHVDLFALLFTYLGNAQDRAAASAFRTLARSPTSDEEIWRLPTSLRDDTGAQERIFIALAGPYMGSNRRRGKTYTWVPNHLADGLNRVSPRSFLAAIRGAAGQAPAETHPLSWRGIQEGVRIASRYRVDEIGEDLPRAHRAMEMLSQLVVPCTKAKIMTAWRRGNLENPEGLFDELRRVGIMSTLQDGRINIPDVYRVGFGLRRKGGLAPRI